MDSGDGKYRLFSIGNLLPLKLQFLATLFKSNR